jgi:uncharacterized membrane protein (UPF0127 family)
MKLFETLKDAYRSNYQGSIADLLRQQAAVEIASTEEQRVTGLSEGPPRTMVFPDVQGQPFNTRDMQYPIDIKGYDKKGDIVQSYMAVEPGIENLPMSPEVDTVIENPSEYRTGGYARPSERLRQYKPGSTLKKK